MSQRLLDILNVVQIPNHLSSSALIIIDAQREYLDGRLPLVGIDKALTQIQELLKRARKLNTKIWFIRHSMNVGSPIFNPTSKYFQIIDEVVPLTSESIIDKYSPSCFTNTKLSSKLQSAGINKLIVTGFMTHACISASVRAANDLGFMSTVVAEACATRDLPDKSNNTITADTVHNVTLAALSDLFATVVASSNDVPD